MSYRIAGIDVHKKMLAVVVADVEVQGEYQFERIRYGSNPEPLRLLVAWLIEHEVEEVVMESTAQYRSPKSNRHMPRILNQAANAAVKSKGTMFEIVYRRLVTRLGHNQIIGAIAHRLCRLIWIILHRGVRYEERGPSVSTNARRQRTTRMIRELRNLGYRVEPVGTAA
jgi:hypothetical protein